MSLIHAFVSAIADNPAAAAAGQVVPQANWNAEHKVVVPAGAVLYESSTVISGSANFTFDPGTANVTTTGTVTANSLTSTVGNITTGANFTSGHSYFQIGTSSFYVRNDFVIGWTNGGFFNSTLDTGVSRISAGVIGVGNGVAADHSAQAYAATVRTNQTLVSGLPAAATAGAGARAFVTDALGPVFGSTVVGGGGVSVPVYSDGSAWNVG